MTNTAIDYTIRLQNEAKKIGMNKMKFGKVVKSLAKTHPYHDMGQVAEEIAELKSQPEFSDLLEDSPAEIASLIDDIWDEVYGY